MNFRFGFALVLLVGVLGPSSLPSFTQVVPQGSFGYTNFDAEAKLESQFLAVPDPKLAGEDLKTLTAEPHLAATPEDLKTAEFVARKFRAAGLDTQIVPYRVLLDHPKVVRVEAWNESGHPRMSGPNREHVNGDPDQDNPRIVMPYNSSSGSGDVTAQAVYGNFCRPQDFRELAPQHIDRNST